MNHLLQGKGESAQIKNIELHYQVPLSHNSVSK